MGDIGPTPAPDIADAQPGEMGTSTLDDAATRTGAATNRQRKNTIDLTKNNNASVLKKMCRMVPISGHC